jgi:hypothetical protein
MRAIRFTRALVAADADGIAEVQEVPGAGDLTLDGNLVAGGIAQLGQQRKVILTAEAGDDFSAVTFTISGTDDAGRSISESLAGPQDGVTSPVSSVLDYSTVTSIAASAAGPAGDEISAGTNGVGASMPIPLDQYISPFNVSIGCDVTGTINYTVQFTLDDVFAGTGVGPFTWFAHPDITGSTADDTGTYISPVSATRVLTNSGTGSVAVTLMQAGIGQ